MSFFKEFDHLRIPLEDIKQATKNFAKENLIGIDGFGKVYKGELLRREGLVAFKRLHSMYGQGSSEFWKEIMMLSSFKHENLVSLVGYCDEEGENVLVYEFLARGCLDRYLSSGEFTWSMRLRICLGVARGLNYLHDPPGTQQRVLHRDIKSANILLDENWQAKITDLGLSKISPANQSSTFLISNDVGTLGYIDPLYMETGILTKESDIYSLGIVLFEVLCGRLVYVRYNDGSPSLEKLVFHHYENGTLAEIIDPILRKQMNQDSLNIFSATAYQCLKRDREERPTSFEIVQKLEEALGLQHEFEKALALQQDADNLNQREEDDHSYKVKNMEHMKVLFEDIKLATRDFHKDLIIGRGGFGKVYRANLFHFDVKRYISEKRYQSVLMNKLTSYPRTQSIVAIKRLDRKYGQGTAQFLQELSMVPYFRHQNLVTLVGFCDEYEERILVYEYASNGSLEEYICGTNNKSSLSWAQRLQICIDAANGLNFLHNAVGEHHRVIHRDIKSSNILLGRNLIGMISDFGLSKIGPANLQATFLMTQIAGTRAYIDPQYLKTGMLTKESDVYSFGVVLWEVLSGKLALYLISEDNPECLQDFVERFFKEKKVHEIIDPKLKEEFEKANSCVLDVQTCPESVNIFSKISYQCIENKRDDRPTMVDVVEQLDKALKTHVKGLEDLRTSLDTIKFATNNFSDIFEHGAFGTVYKGELSYSRGHNLVTVMRLDRSHMANSYGEEFYKEMAKLYSYRHKNVIPLIGFCEEASERILLFEHMVNGSLKEHLKNTSLTWKDRLKICVEAAHGLAYIHNGVETQASIHGDIKSSNILLNHDWKPVISDFIISKGAATLGYYDQRTSILTQKSDVYSFGVVLFEVLSGRLAIETLKKDDKHLFHDILHVGREHHESDAKEEEQVIFLARLAAQCFKYKRLEDIIFYDIKGQIKAQSLAIFSAVAYRCLQEQLDDRPTMAEVVKELQKALECQDEWEWEHKLPKDYGKIIQMSKTLMPSTMKKKDLYSLFSSGILIQKEEMWLSLSKEGANNEMISAKRFLYKNLRSLKWRSIRKSRFPKVAKMLDTSNLNTHIKIKTQFLSLGTIYGAYLVFKYCDQRKVSGGPLHVNLKYKTPSGTKNAYIAEPMDEEWMRIELDKFKNHNQTYDFEVLLKSFLSYSCTNAAIFIEGIAFQAIENVHVEHMENVKWTLNTDKGINYRQPLPNAIEEILERSQNKEPNITEEELYMLLSKGILIDNEEKIFSLSKENGKKCHMLSAKTVIYKSSNVKYSNCKPSERSRFMEVVELQSHHAFHIKCNIETKMLSEDTTYTCYLVFELSENCMGLKFPVKARDLLHKNNKDTTFIYFRSPSFLDLHRDKRVPRKREDGWKEVMVCELNSYDEHNDYIPLDLKLVCLEGNMCGLFIYGIEFRPT